MTKALEVVSVSKSFSNGKQKTDALRNVSFDIEEGEAFGFVGPNGAGKSTTIKILLNIINDYQGEMRLYGKNARDPAARKGISYLPESPAIYEQLTPLEVLRIALEMHEIQVTQRNHLSMKWLDKLSISHVANKRISQLSKGTIQRVAIAHAMISQPRLLILDEPLSGLDPVGRRDVIDILAEYKLSGGAIFFTSHVLHDVERIADRFGFIYKGEIISTRSPTQLLTEYADRFIVRYHNSDNTIVDGNKLRDGEYEYELSQDEIPEWLAHLNAHGGHVLSITPAVTLEKVFFHILDERKSQDRT